MIPVTVCTPTIPPRSNLLGRATNSVFEQTVKPAAHVVMVDVHREGAPAMWDKTVRASETEWVATLGDDDEFLPHHLETLWGLVEESNADIAFSSFSYSNTGNAGHLEKWRGVPFDNANPRQITGVFLVRRELVLDVGGFLGGFDPNSYDVDGEGNRIGEDFMIVKKFAEAGARFVNTGDITWLYHVGHGNTLGMPGRW